MPLALLGGLAHRRLSGVHGFAECGFEEAGAGGRGGGEAGFELVAEGHEFGDLGDDAVLLGEGWDGYG